MWNFIIERSGNENPLYKIKGKMVTKEKKNLKKEISVGGRVTLENRVNTSLNALTKQLSKNQVIPANKSLFITY